MDFFSRYNEYHFKVIDSLKKVLYQKDNMIFDKLDFYNDCIFSEPLLFSCVNNKYDEWINTLIFCLTKNKRSLNSINTKAIDNKIIYLPSIGYYILNKEYAKTIKLQRLNDTIQLFDEDNNPLDYQFQSINKNNEGIEFLQCNHPLLKPFFVDEQGNVTEVLISKTLYLKHTTHFNNALEIIKQVYPSYYMLVKNYIKKVVFYQGKANSFATIQAHGTVFFNVKDEYSEVYFLDNILHQCAHVFFNALTFNKKELFKMPHTSDLYLFTEEDDDRGFVLYDRYHGLFTQTNINICMDKCINQKIFDGEQHFELLGRFTSNMTRFSRAIRKFNKINKYKKEGLIWFYFFSKKFEDIYSRNKSLLNKYDVSNQPYVFDYEIFKSTNEL